MRVQQLEDELKSAQEQLTKLKADAEQKDHVLQWTQNKLQAESEKGNELAENLAKTSTKYKEVAISII